jgi:hypothetical protein
MEADAMLDENAVTTRQAILAPGGVERRMPLTQAPKLEFHPGVRLGRP